MRKKSLAIIPDQEEPISFSSEDIFAHLAQDRIQGVLTEKVSNTTVNFQASMSYPGCIDKIHAHGSKIAGYIINGEFIPLNNSY